MLGEGRILVVKTHAFGDAMLCTPAVRELIAEESDHNAIIVLTSSSAEPVWNRMDGIEEVLSAPFPPKDLTGRIRLLIWSQAIRRRLRGISSSIVLQADPRVRRWVRYLTKAPMRSCGSSPLGSWEDVFPMKSGAFAGEVYAKAAGVEPEDWRPSFSIFAEERAWAKHLLDGRRCFAVAPGGGSNPRDNVPEKRWPAGRYAGIVSALDSSGIIPVLIGSSGDTEAAAEAMQGTEDRCIDLTGRADWGRTAAVMECCEGFLGADSGPAHLAMAVCTPAVVVFGPTDPGALYPPGGVIALKPDLECAPCYSSSIFPGCTRGEAVCTETISLEEAWKAVSRIIHEDNSS